MTTTRTRVPPYKKRPDTADIAEAAVSATLPLFVGSSSVDVLDHASQGCRNFVVREAVSMVEAANRLLV